MSKTFIVAKAFKAHFPLMGRYLLSSGIGIVLCTAVFMPEPAFARDNEQNEQANCTDPKHRHTAVRPLTESVPVRKKDKERVRRVLM
ncbi:MAG: hypothetical protein IBJ12_08385 [Sphingomonadaceae bacterium]|nr:hypothetical protein [Sphingomonadaceae bacterium]